MNQKNSENNLQDNSFRQPRFFLSLNCLFLSRIRNGNGASVEDFSQEIDVYLLNLREAIDSPEMVEHLRPYLNDYDIDSLRRLERSSDARLRYIIYRAKDDFVLFSVGTFESETAESLPVGPEFTNGEQGQMGRGRTHYRFAFTYGETVSYLGEALGGVLENLAAGFQKYATIVSYMDGETFDIARRLKGAETYHLDRSVEKSASRRQFQEKLNEFLDAYLHWKSRLTDDAKERVMSIAAELRKLDPSFTYNPT